jgi:uncharacterized membrane protein YdfJ with MMPL/SSD domain
MMWIWIALAAWSVIALVVEFVFNTEKAEPIDLSDPDGEDKWGAM